jgi:hypothetical protein
MMASPAGRLLARLCLFMVLVLPAGRLPAAEPVPPQNIEKMVGLLRASGYSYRTTNSPTVWVVHLSGKHLSDIKVILALGTDADSDLVIFVTLVEKRRMPVTVDFRGQLLEQAHVMNQVKIAFDRDGDLSVRFDASLRLADPAFLKNVVTQITNVSDDLYGQIEPQLLP